MAVGQNKTTQA